MVDLKIEKFVENYRQDYVNLATEFYKTDAVLGEIPVIYIENTADELLKGSPYTTCYMAIFCGLTAGYVLLSHTYSQEAGGMALWIEELYIKPQFQGKGIGKKLLEYVLENNDYKRVRLEVEKENERACNLYKQYGFDFFAYDQMKLGN